jgi:hypothetical protein
MSLGDKTVPVRKRASANRKRRARKRNHFRQRDLSRALRACRAAGVSYPIIRITKDGEIIVTASDRPERDASAANPWDEVLNDAAHEKRPA